MALIAIGVAAPRLAAAQYNVPSQASGESRTVEIARDEPSRPKAAKRPLAWELGASLDFMTSSDPSLGGKKLKFTDIALFRGHGLIAIGKRAEVFAGVDLLPKQPSYTDELVWQSALVGARVRFSAPWSAYVRGLGGPGLDRDGYWWMGEAALQYRLDLAEKILFWENALGGTFTQLFPDNSGGGPFWQTELLAQSGIAVREKRGFFATWLSFTFQFPLAARPEPRAGDPITVRALDPHTRVGLAFGMVGSVSKTVDLFVEVSVLDRGDPDDPRTTLPILSGGFDQNRIVFGFNRRFGDRRHR